MPLVSALEAHFGFASEALQFEYFGIGCTHVRLTARPRAPAHQRVFFQSLLVLETLILHEKLALVGENFIDFRCGNLFQAFSVQASYFVHLCILNVLLQILIDTVAAEFMATLEHHSTFLRGVCKLICVAYDAIDWLFIAAIMLLKTVALASMLFNDPCRRSSDLLLEERSLL